jgi:hypothetical protein
MGQNVSVETEIARVGDYYLFEGRNDLGLRFVACRWMGKSAPSFVVTEYSGSYQIKNESALYLEVTDALVKALTHLTETHRAAIAERERIYAAKEAAKMRPLHVGYAMGYNGLKERMTEEYGPDAQVWYSERNGDGLVCIMPPNATSADLPCDAMNYGIAEWIDPDREFGTGVRPL